MAVAYFFMWKVLTVFVLVLLFPGSVFGAGFNEDAGTGAEASASLDRPWYVQVEVFLDDVSPTVADVWSDISDSLFGSEEEGRKPVQTVGKGS